MKVLTALFVLVATVSILGCGSGQPWSPVPIRGKITYEDGSLIPAQSIRLYFSSQEPPKDSATVPRRGVVDVNVADGTFKEATTYRFGDGLIPGKHRVTVAASDSAGPNVGTGSKGVPREYASGTDTPLIIDTADAPLEIKIRKP